MDFKNLFLWIAFVLPTSVLSQSITNPKYEKFPEPSIIQRDLSGETRIVRRNYDKLVHYTAPNGGKIKIVATKDVSDEQVLRAYGILGFFLTDVPSSTYGADKSSVANFMASQDAMLVMPGGADGRSPIRNRALVGQPLYALEFPVEGSKPYLTNDFEQRDAGFEEIFHMVQDLGIGTKFTDGALKNSFQREAEQITKTALEKGLWGRGDSDVQNWIAELRQEGSLQQEYFAAILDSYFGYWGGWEEGSGGMWGIYAAKTREDVIRTDPKGAKLLQSFLPDRVTYMARIDPSFQGTFEMSFDAQILYTHKSQYLTKARLLGNLASNISGNNFDNVFMGNPSDNHIDGKQGRDIVQYPLASTDVTIGRLKDGSVIVHGAEIGKDILVGIELLRFTDRDVPL